MRRNGWKRPKADEAALPSDNAHGDTVAADDCSPSKLSHQDGKQAKPASAESDPAELKSPGLADEPGSPQDAGALEGVAEITTKSLEDQTIDDAPDDDGAVDDEAVPGDPVGWTIQLSRGRIVDVTERHVVLSDDALGFIVFEDGESLSIEGIRRIGW